MRNRAQRTATLEIRLRRHDPALRLAHAQQPPHPPSTTASPAWPPPSPLPVTPASPQRTARLQTLSPLAVLNRGYAIVYTAEGTILLNPDDAQPDQQIHARLAQGTLTARVSKAE